MESFDQRATTLDLNGPVLSITTQPDEVSTCGVATFIGIATATFPTQTPANPAKLTGSLSYQWYYSVGSATTNAVVTNGTMAGLGLTGITGAGTTTLTVYGTSTTEPYTLEGIKFFIRPDYVPSAYGTGDPITAGTGRSTGNANNEILDSNSVAYTFYPTITIDTQPTAQTAIQNVSSDFTVVASISDNSDLTYKWILNGTDITDSSTASGSDTSTLSLSLDEVGVSTVRAKVSHPTACNSPVYSSVVDYDIVDSRQIINFELLDGNGNFYGNGSHNIFDSAKTFEARTAVRSRALCVYAPEQDIITKVTLAGGAGRGINGRKGGEGGLSTFYFTMEQNVEYIVKLGSSISPSGGGGGGGGAAFIYKGGTLMVVVGGGGGSGEQRDGGAGGGVSVAGQDGFGAYSGNGGGVIAVGGLPLQGYFPGGQFSWADYRGQTGGGRVSGCTFGPYWLNRHKSACENVGFVKFFGAGGQEISESTNKIMRGYKSGLGHRNNGGNSSATGGGGGSGANGGSAATRSEPGGGGGSGYSSGEVTILNTQLGGNTDQDGYITFEVYSE